MSSTPHAVDAWSTVRLPFEPKGWLLEFRTALRHALWCLASPNRMLYACYTSQSLDPCDVENILLYNVGTSAFSQLSATDIVLERRFEAPPAAVTLDGPVRNHYRYTVDAVRGLPEWPIVASWAGVDLAPPFTIERVWAALQPAVAIGTRPEPAAHLAVDLQVERPAAVTRPSVLAMTKSVVDGAIAAVHAHDRTDLTTVAERLASRLQSTAALVADRLTDSTRAVLGVRKLLWPFRNFVQWNPADDRITYLRLRSIPGSHWRLSGTITAADET